MNPQKNSKKIRQNLKKKVQKILTLIQIGFEKVTTTLFNFQSHLVNVTLSVTKETCEDSLGILINIKINPFKTSLL